MAPSASTTLMNVPVPLARMEPNVWTVQIHIRVTVQKDILASTVRRTSMNVILIPATTGPAPMASQDSPVTASPATLVTDVKSTSTSARACPARTEESARTAKTAILAGAPKEPQGSIVKSTWMTVPAALATTANASTG